MRTAAAEPAGRVFHNRVGLRKDSGQILVPSLAETSLGLAECVHRFADPLRRWRHLARKLGKLAAERVHPGADPFRDGGDPGAIHPLEMPSGWDIEGMVAREMPPPAVG